MGNSYRCCPKPTTTAVGRRALLDTAYWAETPLSDKIKLTTEYVEKPSKQICFTKLFEPKDPRTAKAMIFFSIGFADNIEWFRQIAAKYAELGFLVFLHDHKGHGRTDGYFAAIDDFETDFVDEAIWVFQYAIHKYIKSHEIYKESIDKHNKYFLSGTSMGGAVSLKIALKQQHRADNPFKGGVVITSPMIGMDEDLKPPMWQILCMQYCCLPCCPYFAIVPNGLNEALTEDKEIQQLYDADPVRWKGPLPLTTAHNLYQTTLQIERSAKDLRMPLFIGHGDNDRATDCALSRKFYDQCGCAQHDKVLRIYPGKGHLIYHEEPQIFEDTAEWMMQRIEILMQRDEQTE